MSGDWIGSLRVRPWSFALLFLLAFHLFLFGVPALAGYPVWTGGQRITSILPLPQTIDTATFATLTRPIRTWLTATLSRGDLPLWLDTQALGIPLIEQYEYNLFYPLEWVKWLGADGWWTTVLCLELTGAGFGLYLAARRILGVSAPAALAGAVVFTGIGYPTWFYLSVGFFTPILQLPFVLLLLHRLAHAPVTVRQIAGLAILAALILLTGQPQLMLCSGIGLGALFAIELLAVRRSRDDLMLRLGAAGLAGLLALAIAAPQIVPFVQDQVWNGAYSNHPFDLTGRRSATSALNLLNPVSPFLQGPIVPWIDDSQIVPVSTDDFGLSFGAAGAFLVLVGIWTGLRAGGVARRLALLLTVSLGAIVWMTLVDSRIWPFAMVNVTRYSPPVLGLFGAMLAAYGADRLYASDARVIWIALMAVFAVPVAGVLYLWVNLSPERIRDAWLMTHAAVLTVAPLVALAVVVVGIASRQHGRLAQVASFAQAGLLAVVGESLFAMRYGLALEYEWVRLAPPGLFACAALLALAHRTRTASWAGAAALGLIVGHWAYLSPQLDLGPQSSFGSPSIPALSTWRDRANGPARILAHRGWLHPNFNAPLGIQSLANRNPVAPVALVGYLYEFWRPSSIEQNKRTLGMIQFEGASVQHQVQPDGSPVLPDNALDWGEYFAARPFFNLVGVNVLVDDLAGPLRQIIDRDDVKDLRGIHRDDCTPESRSAYGGYCIEAYEDRRALPRAYLAPTYATVPKTRDGWAARYWLAENRRNMHQTPVAEFDHADLPSFDGVTGPLSSMRPQGSASLQPARIVSYKPTEVIVEVDGRRSGLLVLNDTYHPGWRVLVEGRQRPLVRVNSVVRGVVVYQGERVVRFTFENGFARNVTISLGTLLVLVLAVLVPPRLRGRRAWQASAVAVPTQTTGRSASASH